MNLINPGSGQREAHRTLQVTCALICGLVLLCGGPATASHCAGDTLIGGGGDDTIIGSNCDDVLVGNDGDNDIAGAQGHDVFAFSTGYCARLEWDEGWIATEPSPGDCFVSPIRFFPNFGVSEIEDFAHGFDRLGLDKATFTALRSEVGSGFSDPSDFQVVDNDALAETTPATIAYSVSSATLFYNENADAPGFGEGGPFALLDGVTSLVSSDFAVLDWTPVPEETTTTSSSTTTSTTVPTTTTTPRPTTTTTLACTTARCTLDAALESRACSDKTLPLRITKKIARALDLLDSAEHKRPRKRTNLRNQAASFLKQAAKSALGQAAKQKLSAECAADIQRAADGVRDSLDVSTATL
jgi:hypothetical protein